MIAGLLGLRRSGLAGPTPAATGGLELAIAGTAVLLLAELAQLPVAGEHTANTGPMIVSALFGPGTMLSAIGLLAAGRAALRSGTWHHWGQLHHHRHRRVDARPRRSRGDPAVAVGVALYGLCMLALALATHAESH